MCVLLPCREVWPGEEFGTPGISVDDEVDIIRTILFNTSAGWFLNIGSRYVNII